jgi:Zn-dependent protease
MTSWQVARVRGIPIRIHISLLITAGLIVLQWGALGLPATALLFGSVLLHELGHAVVAQRLGIGISGIHLHLLGGVALMKGTPKRPSDEVFIAAAGPAVSLALAAAFGGLAWATGATLRLQGMGLVDLLAYAALLNAAMALFNLLPALPMDGGRIFRAALVRRLGPVRATQWAARVSRGFGALFILGGIAWGAWSLGLIGLLLLVLSRHEERVAEQQERLRLEELERERFAVLRPWPPVTVVEEWIDPSGRRVRVVRSR